MATDNSSEVLGFDPIEAETDEGFYRQLFRMHDQQIQHCLPCIVTKYDPMTGIVTVRPLVKYIKDTSGGTVYVNRPTYDIRAITFKHGGISIQSPIYVGDTGWMIACDRDSTSAIEKNKAENLDDAKEEDGKFGENEGPQAPYSDSLPSFMFGFFIPDCWNEPKKSVSDGLSITYTPKGGDENGKVNVTIDKDAIKLSRITDGTTETISVSDDGIKFDGNIDRIVKYAGLQEYDSANNVLYFKKIEQKIRGDAVVGVDVGKETIKVPVGGGSADVGDGKLTVTSGGATLGTFTANQKDDETIDVPKPNDATITLNMNGSDVDSFTLNQSSDNNIKLIAVPLNSDTPTRLEGNSIITNIQYNYDTHYIQVKMRSITTTSVKDKNGNDVSCVKSLSKESDWINVIKCVEHTDS